MMRRECSCCGYLTDCAMYPTVRLGRDDLWLCSICANTPAGNAEAYPEQNPNLLVMRQISWIGNALLAAIAEAKRNG